MALVYTTITQDFTDGSGAALSGAGWVEPSADVYSSSGALAIPGTQILIAIVAGELVLKTGAPLSLLATDQSGLKPEGMTAFWYYTISLSVGNQVAVPWSFQLPSSPSSVSLWSLASS